MRRIASLVICIMSVCAFPILGMAQTNIIEHLQTNVSGQGKISIEQSSSITSIIGSVKYNQIKEERGRRVLISQGYRVQLYSGNQQRESKAEALKRETAFKTIFPEIPTYLTFQSPFWRLRVGNFLTMDECNKLIAVIKRTMPEYSRSLIVIRDEVSLPL